MIHLPCLGLTFWFSTSFLNFPQNNRLFNFDFIWPPWALTISIWPNYCPYKFAVLSMAYIWKPNSWGILLGYNGILKSFSRDTTDFVVYQLLLFECISIDAYVGKAGVLILAFFDLSCFLILYLDCFHMEMLIGVLMSWSALPSAFSLWFSR